MIIVNRIAVTILALLVLYFAKIVYHHLCYHYKMRREGCQPLPPYPHKDPILGYDLYKTTAEGVSQGKIIPTKLESYARCGQGCKTFQSKRNGDLVINTFDGKNIHIILGPSSSKFVRSPLNTRLAEPFLGRGLITSEGKAWRQARAIATAALSTDQAADLPSLEKYLQKMLLLIPADGSTIDLQPLLKRLFIDRGTELVLGESVNSLSLNESSNSDIEVFLDLFESVLRGMGQRLRLGRFVFIRGRDVEWKQKCAAIHAALDKFVDQAIARRTSTTSMKPSRYLLVDRYLDITNDKEAIRTQLLHVFLAGRDQIAISMSLLMFALARHPRVWDKLRKEALKHSPQPSIEHVKALSYTRNVILEGFRLYSSVLWSQTYCIADCKLPHGGGPDGQSPILVPRGAAVEIHSALMHRDKDIWGNDAEDFVPERWEGRPGRWDFIPFSAGRRICPARDMSLMQMTYTLSRLAGEFEKLENRDPVIELVDDIRNVRQSRNGVKVGLIAPGKH